MAVEADLVYRTREQVTSYLLAGWLSRIPDAWVEEDGNARMFFETLAGEIEGVYLANQLLRDNIFVQSANYAELRMHGEQFGLLVKAGTRAEGEVRFQGTGGVVVPINTQVASDPGTGDILYYYTTQTGTIPDPGVPTAPTTADSGVAGNPPAGTYEYVVTYQTVEGETMPGPASAPLVTSVARQVSLTNIPVGGPGTTGRRIYRRRDAGAWGLVTTIANNTTLIFTDNVADGSLGASVPVIDTAHRVTVDAVAEKIGFDYNVIAGAIETLTQTPSGVASVTNIAPFAGGSDDEDLEQYRQRLLEFLRNPKSGSKGDLEDWAEAIEGVEQATAFSNENLGVAAPGHVTVRISGPDGSVPSGAKVAEVQAALDEQDLASITIHVTTFTPVPTNVTVATTLASGYVLADVTPNVQQAIANYINSVPVGGTVHVAGLYEAVYGKVGGVVTMVVSTPTVDQTSTSVQKRTAGTITVT